MASEESDIFLNCQDNDYNVDIDNDDNVDDI